MARYIPLTLAIALLLLPGTVAAKEKPTVLLLPFSASSSEDIGYIQKGLLDMLASRIPANNKIEVIIQREIVQEKRKERGINDLTLADIYSLGKKLNADFAVFGNISKAGSEISINGKLVDINSYKSSLGILVQAQGLDEIVPQVNDFAQRITGYIESEYPSQGTRTSTAASIPDALAPDADKEGSIIAGMKEGKRETFTSLPYQSNSAKEPDQETSK